MSVGHHGATDDVTTATAAGAVAAGVVRHAEGDTRSQHGSAAPGFDPAAAAQIGMPPGIDANMSAPPRAHDPG